MRGWEVSGASGMISACVVSVAVSDLHSDRRLAGAAGAVGCVQGRRTARVASRGRGIAPRESTTSPGLGRPGGPGRVASCAAQAGQAASPGDAGDTLALASPPGRAQLELPETHRTPAAAREVAARIVPFARDNASWGYQRSQGELGVETIGIGQASSWRQQQRASELRRRLITGGRGEATRAFMMSVHRGVARLRFGCAVGSGQSSTRMNWSRRFSSEGYLTWTHNRTLPLSWRILRTTIVAARPKRLHGSYVAWRSPGIIPGLTDG